MMTVAPFGRMLAKVSMIGAGLLVGLTQTALAEEIADAAGPEVVLERFLKAAYSRDAAAAYALIARADRDVKTLEDYAEETRAFDGPSLMLAQALADGIRMENIDVRIEDDRAEILFDAILPNANDSLVDDLVHGFDQARLTALTPAAFATLEKDIRRRAETGLLPALTSQGESWDLVLEDGVWRVFENWAEAVEVNFEAVTFHELGFDFEPLRKRVMAKHGETIQMAYRAKNIGTSEATGKARHIIGPDGDADYLDIIACFCFLEATLSPGEEVELPLTFRVDYEAPEDIEAFTVKYEFYPADQFPDDAKAGAQVQG